MKRKKQSEFERLLVESTEYQGVAVGWLIFGVAMFPISVIFKMIGILWFSPICIFIGLVYYFIGGCKENKYFAKR